MPTLRPHFPSFSIRIPVRLFVYEQTSELNHRCKLAYAHIHSRLHQLDEFGERLTFPLVQAAAAHMLKKISLYKADQLLGGSLREPTGKTKEIASEMVPANDISESALGLNDTVLF